MGVADRLYEVACEIRDQETRLDRLTRELHDKELENEHLKEELAAALQKT